MRFGGGAFVLSVLVMTGCASGASQAAGAPATQAATPHTSRPSDSGPTATTAQYASIVAKEQVSFDKELNQMLSPSCDWTSPGSVDADGGLTCSMGTLTVGFHAQTLSLVLAGAEKAGGPAFIGAPPPEIRSLVQDTISAADTLAQASTDANPCTFPKPQGADCVSKLFTFSSAMQNLQGQLAAWNPYD